MRKKYKTIRKQQDTVKGTLAANIFMKSKLYKDASCVMVYMPISNETDTQAIIDTCFNDGKKVVVPVTDEKSGIIIPFEITKNTVYKTGGFGIKEPENAIPTSKSNIDIVIVPGICFDKYGNRIGFGKGCYDRFLKGMNVIKIGYCYDIQLTKKIPSQKQDIKMDYIITDKQFIKCEV